jgi:TonB-dependent receptor
MGTQTKSTRVFIRLGVSLAALMVGAGGGLAQAQDAAPAATNTDAGDNSVVVVTGYRKSVQQALTMKKNSGVMLDAINADDIASFPEANLAESLQRIPGISIDRDNGEGRTISVRGLGGDFTRVRINGMEALSTAGSNDSGTSPNRSRAFDFNTFASDLFNNIQVRKTADAQTDEGSLGATVDLNTGHPFDYKGQKFALSVEDAYYENGGHQNPRIAGLYSTRWDNGKLGFLISAAYQSRDTSIDSYARQAGSADYDYRGTSWAGNEYPQRAGFAAPTGTVFNQMVLTAAGSCPSGPSGSTVTPSGSQAIGTICSATSTATGQPVNYAITNPEVLAAIVGSDPTAYATLYPSSNATAGRFDDSTVRIPALATLNDQELHSDRLGITSSFQAQLDDNTRITIDYLHSRFHNESTNYQIQSVGLNRNNTNVTLNTVASTASIATKRALYPGLCTPAAATAIVFAVDCGAQLYGTTPAFATGSDGKAAVLGTNIFSTNPNDLDPYDYYNNPLSVGYTPDAMGTGGIIQLLGRPTTKVLAAQVDNGVADYLQLSNVDWRSAADASFYTTNFDQLSVNFDHRFSDTFKMNAVIGMSKSLNVNQGLLVEFDSMDRPETFTYDERGSPNAPVVNPGWNVADSTQWSIIKGFSAMRNYIRDTANTYSQVKTDFDWSVNDHHELRFGVEAKKYTFSTDQFERPTDTLAPTQKEAGVTVASLGSVHSFGQGLDLAAGTPTSFFAPSIDAFSKVFGFDCNCVNKYGDFRLTNLKSGSAQYGVDENDGGAYVQLDFNYTVLGMDLSGNLGVREATTDVVATGHDNKQRPVTDSNHYTDTLPSLNLNWHIQDNLFMRFGASKDMARPLLGNLNPAISAVTIPSDGSVTGGSITIGNTHLKPFRSANYDWDIEWYFAKNSLLSFALFDKEIKSFPQTVLFDAPIQQFFSGDALTALEAQFTNAQQLAYITGNDSVTARQFRDAPGGYLRGEEFNFQTDFGYLPDHVKWMPTFVKNFGLQLNATHIDSKLKYILDPGTEVKGVVTKAPTYAYGPWLNASPDAVNLTVYYEVPQFSVRVSVAQRAGYDTTFPIAAGSCNPGLQPATNTTTAAATSATEVACDSPLVNDFIFSKSTTNVDANFSWNFDEHLSMRLEGLNLTNQTSNRYAYTSNPVVTSYASTGRQITLGLRYKY